jgi:hypothetical protein
VAALQDLLTLLLQESRAALESPGQAHATIRDIVQRFSRRAALGVLAPA